MVNLLAIPNGFEIVIIVLIIVILFGSAKIPQLMRGLGSGINEFKKGLKDGEGGEAKPGDAPKPAETAAPAPAPQAEAPKPPAPPEAK